MHCLVCNEVITNGRTVPPWCRGYGPAIHYEYQQLADSGKCTYRISNATPMVHLYHDTKGNCCKELYAKGRWHNKFKLDSYDPIMDYVYKSVLLPSNPAYELFQKVLTDVAEGFVVHKGEYKDSTSTKAVFNSNWIQAMMYLDKVDSENKYVRKVNIVANHGKVLRQKECILWSHLLPHEVVVSALAEKNANLLLKVQKGVYKRQVKQTLTTRKLYERTKQKKSVSFYNDMMSI